MIPSSKDWLSFCHFTRNKSSSFSAFKVVISRVAFHGRSVVSNFLASRGLPCPDKKFIDPRAIYKDANRNFMTILRRNSGVSVRKTLPLSVLEVSNSNLNRMGIFVLDSHACNESTLEVSSQTDKF